MSCPVSHSQNVLFPSVLAANEICEAFPFSHPQTKDEDLKEMRARLPRALAVLVTLLAQHKKERYQTPDLRREGDVVTRQQHTFIEFSDVLNSGCNMRYLVPNLDKFEQQPKFFIIGFFGFALPTSTVVQQIWDLDDKLVTAIPTFDGILAYITMKKDDGQYFNYVFLESYEMVSKWRGLRTHESAVWYSPRYYSHVRINHAVLPCTIMSLFENQTNINKLDIIRTKYYHYAEGKMDWSAVRVHKPDPLYQSIPYKQNPRPFLFASFLGENAFNFYSEIVAYIGKTTGLPVKMIDVAALTAGVHPRPADIASIEQLNIDFAFTCGISYVNSFPNLTPLAAPVRVEERYQNKPVYFSDIIVRADSPYRTQEDLQSKVFAINEQVSLSGHLMPQHHFLSKGGLQKFFSKVVESTAHSSSIAYVIDGKADAAGIDSVVLDMELKQRPERKEQLRVIESTAPCTMPPFVASPWVARSAQKLVSSAISTMHHKPEMQEMLQKNGFSRFARVQDKDYDSVRLVRKMYHNAN